MGKIDTLPQTLTVQGKAYPIKTGFRSWIAFEGILNRNDLTIEEKQVFALRRVLKSPAPPDPFLFLELFLQAAWFCRCGLPNVPSEDDRQLLDLKKDFWAVWADFKTYNGIDLTQQDMHWWQFMALFHSLPQGCQIRRRMEIRGIGSQELSKMKDAKQRREIRRLQRLYALEDSEYEDED